MYGEYTKKSGLKYFKIDFSPINYNLIRLYNRVIFSHNKQTHTRKPGAGVSKAAKRQQPGAGRARQGWVYAGGRRVVTVPNAVSGRLAHPPGKRKKLKLNKKIKKLAIDQIYKSIFDTGNISSRLKLNKLSSNCIVVPDDTFIREIKSVKKIAKELNILHILRFKSACNIYILTLKNQISNINSYNLKGYNYSDVESSTNIHRLAAGGLCGRLTLITKSAFIYLINVRGYKI